jgi:PAS domain S-box-containing protein
MKRKDPTPSHPAPDAPAVLIVEDERIVAGDIESRLTLLGYRVVGTVGSGEAASTLSPDLVLMDIRLEGEMDGTQAAEIIHRTLNLPVVYLTAHADNPTLQRAKMTEPYGYLLKPFDDHELRTTIELALYKHWSEKRLKESEARFRGLAETVAAGIFMYRDDRFVYVNSHASTLTGFTTAELLSMSIWDLVHPSFRAELRERAEARKRGEPVPGRYELVIRRNDGVERWIDLAVGVITMDGLPTTLGTAFDITERKQAEESRRVLEAALSQSQKMDSIGTLVIGLAHNFNNLLAIIQGYASRLEKGPVDPPRLAQSIQAIENAAHRGAALIQQLIGVTRKANLQSTPVAINALVADVRALLSEVFPRKIHFVVDADPSDPHAAGDQNQLHQALMNVCLNARDAMPQGGNLAITTSTVDATSLRGRFPSPLDTTYVRITLTDNGMGMPEEVRSRVFEPFFTTKDRAVHTGLGLSVVYGIIASHKGFIDVQSGPGGGTTVAIFLPAVPAPSAVPPDPARRAAIPTTGTETVLVIEDDEMLRILIREVLMREGYTVLDAEDDQEGLRIFEKERERVDLVLLDLGLPGMPGDELAGRFRSIVPGLPVIMTTGLVSPEQATGSSPTVPDALVRKPFTVTDLLLTLRQVLNARRR